jgi:hypothetical protein
MEVAYLKADKLVIPKLGDRHDQFGKITKDLYYLKWREVVEARLMMSGLVNLEGEQGLSAVDCYVATKLLQAVPEYIAIGMEHLCSTTEVLQKLDERFWKLSVSRQQDEYKRCMNLVINDSALIPGYVEQLVVRFGLFSSKAFTRDLSVIEQDLLGAADKQIYRFPSRVSKESGGTKFLGGVMSLSELLVRIHQHISENRVW